MNEIEDMKSSIEELQKKQQIQQKQINRMRMIISFLIGSTFGVLGLIL